MFWNNGKLINKIINGDYDNDIKNYHIYIDTKYDEKNILLHVAESKDSFIKILRLCGLDNYDELFLDDLQFGQSMKDSILNKWVREEKSEEKIIQMLKKHRCVLNEYYFCDSTIEFELIDLEVDNAVKKLIKAYKKDNKQTKKQTT